MGPQLGYYYPEIVEQMDLHGPGYNAQGVTVPGMAMYVLIGRTKNYAWSLTSAGHDVRDVFAEKLCEPDGSAPTRSSKYYEFNGRCRPFENLERRAAERQAAALPEVRARIGDRHGDGRRQALRARAQAFDLRARRAQPGRAQGHDRRPRVARPRRFWRAANQFGFTFNWAYASRKATAVLLLGPAARSAPADSTGACRRWAPASTSGAAS